jgi:hypothetical protein
VTLIATTAARARAHPARLLILVLSGVLIGIGAYAIVSTVTQPRRTTPVYDPPVLAGQQIPWFCSGGVYARRGETIVLTTSPHCGGEGTVVYDSSHTLQGIAGPTAQDATCPYPDHTCHASDMNYLVVPADRVPWGHLNVVDLGTAGYRILEPGTQPLTCADIAVGDLAEMDGRNIYRSGAVTEKGENLAPAKQDGSYFPCMITAQIQVGGGDSGSVVLVRGIPAGVTSRTFSGLLGFTPLAEGLAQLGLELCTTPDCDLLPPTADATLADK